MWGKKEQKKELIGKRNIKVKKFKELMSQYKSTPIKRDNKTLDFLKNLL